MGLTQTFGEEVAQGGRSRTGGEGHGHWEDERAWTDWSKGPGLGQAGANQALWENPGHSGGFALWLLDRKQPLGWPWLSARKLTE